MAGSIANGSHQLRFLEQTELAYLAGIIDGEGHIGIHKQKSSKDRHYHHGYCYFLVLAVQMCDAAVPMWLYTIFGGSIYEAHSKREHHRTAYQWQVRANKAENVLSLVLPYLKLKKSQAEIAITFQKTKVTYKKEFRPYGPKADILIEAESILAEQVKQLNAGGLR